MRVLTIGLDGATWALLNKLIDDGVMPNLQKIIKRGVSGNLRSTFPPVTASAWVSFATGKNPGKHGCYDFVLPDRSLKNLRPISSKTILGPTFYEILHKYGKKYISINLPCSMPPRADQITIGDILTQGDVYIFPKNLVNEIPEFKDYRITPQMKYKVEKKFDFYLDDIQKLEKTRFKCAQRLFLDRHWEYFFMLISATDWIQHILYDKLINNKNDKIISKALDIYKEIDFHLGWFFGNMPINCLLIIVSDHGFEKYEYQFNVNQWLLKEGFLKARRIKEKIPASRGEAEVLKVKKDKIVFDLPMFITKFSKLIKLMRPFYDILTRILPIEVNTLAEPVAEKSLAYCCCCPCSNIGAIYINDKERFEDGIVDLNQYEIVRNQIIEKLNYLNNQLNINIIQNVYSKEQIYSGSVIRNAPDILFICNEKVTVCTSITSTEIISKSSDMLVNGHSMDGIFVASGPGIKKDFKLNDVQIIDIAPTILHIFGCPIPDDVDGRCLKEIFEEDSELYNRQIVYSYSQEKERIKRKIGNLKNKRKIGRLREER